MIIPFTKMQGTGNDFVVIDETQSHYGLSERDYQFIADRHFGVGADQILTVRSSAQSGVDFEYHIHNADGSEVEHCGNGARCFLRFVREQGLSQKNPLKVKIKKGLIELLDTEDGQVSVKMGVPVFEPSQIPLDVSHTQGVVECSPDGFSTWRLALPGGVEVQLNSLSMGNPHAVLRVEDVETAPVATWGPLIERHLAFPNRVNVGFMQIHSRDDISLRVFERGAGETLACGTGACAAVVSGIRSGVLAPKVQVKTRGGSLMIEWAGEGHDVVLSGPAVTVFKGELDRP
jgi:diaminopimelate epimerase